MAQTSHGHRRSIRLRHYDYRTPGWYFITILVKNRSPVFGCVVDGEILLSEIGMLATSCLLRTNQHHVNALVDEHIVMPDHMHYICQIRECRWDMETAISEQFGAPQRDSLPTLVRLFKAAVTREAHRQNLPWPGWHRGFYERIIRTPGELKRVRRYIRENPRKSR